MIEGIVYNNCFKAHFHSGKFSAERKFCKMLLADANFPSGKNFEIENFQLLTMIFSEDFVSVENFLERNGPSNLILGNYTEYLTYNQPYLWRDLNPFSMDVATRAGGGGL